MTTRKSTPKKPKARRMWADADFGQRLCSLIHRNKVRCTVPVAVLDVSDEAALIEVVAVAITDDQYPREVWAALDNELRDSYRDSARAALTALGVLPKRRGK